MIVLFLILAFFTLGVTLGVSYGIELGKKAD